MSSVVSVAIHSSQAPEQVRRDLLESLRTRRVNHKFHYDSIKQTNKWLALHQAYSPSRHEADCLATYDRAFAEAVTRISAQRVHVIGLGCGGGQKDTRLLQRLKQRNAEVFYTPTDVSVAMTLVARKAALGVVPARNCYPLVCDLATADDLPALFAKQPMPRHRRLITFFGMIPNFEPRAILPKLAALVRRHDFLLFSANLSPGPDYAAGLRRVLPQYDNPLTREWLLAFLLDLGIEPAAGELRISGETVRRLKRIVARFHFGRRSRIVVDDETFAFGPGDTIQLFFSYRYTPALIRRSLQALGIAVQESWITKSEEEGVFLCQMS